MKHPLLELSLSTMSPFSFGCKTNKDKCLYITHIQNTSPLDLQNKVNKGIIQYYIFTRLYQIMNLFEIQIKTLM